MPTLSQRVDASSITVSFLKLPKGKKRGSGISFVGSEPIASVEGAGYSSPSFRWVDGKPELIGFQDLKRLSVRGASDNQVAGYWSTPKGAERALVWTRASDGTLNGVELHPPKWEKSSALACGDGQQIGFGYEVFVKNPSRALLWSGTRDSIVVLTGPDAEVDAMGMDVAGGIQVGYVGGSGRAHACLWRGTSESFVDLHPAGTVGSEALGTGGGQQVGNVWDGEFTTRAALWSGAADSYVNLSPKKFFRSRATKCSHGFQLGWVCNEDRGMMIRAMLWGGDAEDYIDLQDSLPEPWNASWPMALDVDGDRLRILGTAQHATKSGGYEVNAGEQPVIWEFKLKIAEPRAERALAPAITTAPAEETDEQRVQRVGVEFAQAVVDGDFKTAHSLLAPWLTKQVTAKKLQAILKKEFIDDVPPVDFDVGGNDTTLDELRDHYREYHKDDRTKTLATAEEFGAYGPPSIYVADEITTANYRQWMSIEFTPDPDGDSGLDYCLRLWVIVVESEDTMCIGHLEPGE